MKADPIKPSSLGALMLAKEDDSVIEKVLNMTKAGLSPKAISERLNKDGHKTRFGTSYLPGTVRYIQRNNGVNKKARKNNPVPPVSVIHAARPAHMPPPPKSLEAIRTLLKLPVSAEECLNLIRMVVG